MVDRGVRVLVVDDDPSVCRGIELVLRTAGFEVEQASTGDEAVHRVSQEDFDVIFMDLIMPGIDGTEACRRIKAMKPHLKVVAISGVPSEQQLAPFLTAGGIDFYLAKPFGREELLRAVDRVLELARSGSSSS